MVTSVLVMLLVLVVAGGLYVGYRAIQGKYYLAADGEQVSIYRGISQKIAFMSLSSVYQKTGDLVSRRYRPTCRPAHNADDSGQGPGRPLTHDRAVQRLQGS